VGVGWSWAAGIRGVARCPLILPGAIDAQVHSLSQKDQEDFIWSTRSAAAGGVTTIVDMPYGEGNVVNSAEAVRTKVAHASPQARVDFVLHGTIDPAEGARRIAEQAEARVATPHPAATTFSHKGRRRTLGGFPTSAACSRPHRLLPLWCPKGRQRPDEPSLSSLPRRSWPLWLRRTTTPSGSRC
jgi:hypothetical protein